MTRKLLPYEHELIRALNVSEEEYLEFVQAQFDHTRCSEEKLQEPQGDTTTIALVLTIIGTLFQVAAAFLTPKPQIPGVGKQRREDRFAPRFGFDSTQDLAKYGDPVNLVYCNTSQNTTGGVRVATSLIWSAVSSYGSSQFLQNLLVIGASRINALDITRTAFGQTPIRQFVSQKNWSYFNNAGAIRFNDVKTGDNTDPTYTSPGAYAYLPTLSGAPQEGFSQAFSPSTLSKFGVYAPIPINVKVEDRKSNGETESTPIGITMDAAFRALYWPARTSIEPRRPLIPVGARFTLTFDQAFESTRRKDDIKQTASEARRTLVSGLDAASVYKLGSAKFKLAQRIAQSDLETAAITATFECMEPGICPQEDYETLDYFENKVEYENELLKLETRNTEINQALLFPQPIYLLVNDSPEAQSRLADINNRIDALVDFEENGNKVKNFSNITSNPIYPQAINTLILTIDANEEKIADYQAGGVTRAEKSLIAQLRKQITQQENQLRSLFADYYNGSFSATRKVRAKEIASLQAELAKLGELKRDTAAEAKRDNDLKVEQAANTARIAILNTLLSDPEAFNDFFHTKVLAKVENAAYESITQCNIVSFALRGTVFKRISNRAKKYGNVTVKSFKNSDNGIKLRSMFFRVLYKRNSAASFTLFPYIFVVRRGADVANFFDLTFIAPDNNGNWQFKFEAIPETAADIRTNGAVQFAYIENTGGQVSINSTTGDGIKFSFTGFVAAPNGYLPPRNENPSQTDEWSLFSTHSDTGIQFSFDNGPELEIKAVTEQRLDPFSNYPNLYRNLSLFGFNTFSGQGVQDLRSVTVFVTQGKLIRQLNDDGTYSATANVSSSYAPEIFLDTVIDTVDGIGQYAKAAGIDTLALAKAKRFCQRNNLYFDGVIAEQTPWRQFWAEVAPYSLLELGRIGGKETLVPAVPCDNAGNITRAVPISAMFTAGNILEDSYREENIDYGSSVQDLIASVIYRDTERDGVFPRNRSVDVSLTGVTEATAVRQTFDLSGYVTNRSQAILFAKLLCNQRRYIRRNIEFRTFPTDSPLSPGAYIYVDLGQQDWQGIYSGQVESDGKLNLPLTQRVPDGTYNVLLYRSGQAVINTSASIINNTAASLSTYPGWLFVLGTPVKAKRVFRIVEVQMDEEGEVSVRATEHPCDTNGQSLIADFSDDLFTVR